MTTSCSPVNWRCGRLPHSNLAVGVNYPVKSICRKATSGEANHADKSSESEVVREDDVDSSAGRGGRDSGRALRSSAFAMGGIDSGSYSVAHNFSYYSPHGKGREARPSGRLMWA